MKRDVEKQHQIYLNNYGRRSKAAISEEEMAAIKSYTDIRNQQTNDVTFIDDITWNDLEMDHLYQEMNTTLSSCGDCLLYDYLRYPLMNKRELLKRRELRQFFASHTEERLKVQDALYEVSRPEKGTLFETLSNIDRASLIGSGKYIVLAILTLLAIALLCFVPMAGILILIPLLIVNIFLSLKMKASISKAIDGFQTILRFLSAVEALKKIKSDELSEDVEKLVNLAAGFNGFKRGAFLVTGRYHVSENIGEMLLQYLKLLFHVDLIKYDSMLNACRGHQSELMEMHDILGRLDAAIALASYKEAMAISCEAEMEELNEQNREVCMEMEDLVHPFLKNPVPNSATLKGGILMTGANASGKSTFLKAVAMAAVLAQTTGFSTCKAYRAPFIHMVTSMALTDNLLGGESYYIVEIRSIKRILDQAESGKPMLVIIDEVLRGTNTVERIAASTSILEELKRPNLITLAATHDIELTYLLEEQYRNYHFDEEVNDDQVVFSYRLKEGRATKRNAIRLLKNVGFPGRISDHATAMAENFEAKGEWKS